MLRCRRPGIRQEARAMAGVRIELPGGAVLDASTRLADGTWVYVKGGAIVGEAPDLPYVLIEI